jgi:hypothetical protein
VYQCGRNGTGACEGGDDGSWPGWNSAATSTLLPGRAGACTGSGGDVGDIGAVGAGEDAVADGVANDIVIAVLVG